MKSKPSLFLTNALEGKKLAEDVTKAEKPTASVRFIETVAAHLLAT